MEKRYKICPFCANKIKNGAIKCQYCKEFLNKKDSKKSSSKWRKTVDKYLFNEQNVDYKLDIHHKDLLESCIKTGEKWKTWCWISIIWLSFVFLWIFFASFGEFNWRSSGTIEKIAYTPGKLISLAFIFRFVYFFVWLIKNYRIFLKSKYHVSNLKWYFLLILYWVCPVINLFKPKQILEVFIKSFSINAKNDYNKNLLKFWWIIRDVMMISSSVSILPLSMRWMYWVRFFFIMFLIPLVSYFIHTVLLFKIINKILWAQEYKLKLLWAQELFIKNNKL